ncbi:hypothetical protein SADUNF_Sadunf11G0062400 [Salix dunnii]|uniref:Uncharacterized protein n=1 Tax=Salix dunnii TaxID=1413687 RepID=A0A835JLU2_9ROSI|nr:hypothetical protein SADUNF_Sadunf11G0062400 [Salix dunnii]
MDDQQSYYKIASLFAASAKGAAIFNGVVNNVCMLMCEYVKNLGLPFQVVDDILDFTWSTELLGNFAGKQSPKLSEIIKFEFYESYPLYETTELVSNCGGFERAQELAKEKDDLAIQNLKCLPRGSYQSIQKDEPCPPCMWVSLATYNSLWHMQNIQHILAGQYFLISPAMWPANHIRIGDLYHSNNQPIYSERTAKVEAAAVC